MRAVSPYFECIFGLKELYVYRGVLNAYSGKYREAIADFSQLLEEGSLESGPESARSVEELTDNELAGEPVAMTNAEATYNILVCQLLLEDLKQAEKTSESLAKLLPSKKAKEFRAQYTA